MDDRDSASSRHCLLPFIFAELMNVKVVMKGVSMLGAKHTWAGESIVSICWPTTSLARKAEGELAGMFLRGCVVSEIERRFRRN